MKRIIVVGVLVAALAGCSGSDSEGNSTPSEIKVHYVDTPRGRVLCVWEKSGYGGGLSCDWRNQ